MKDSASPIEDLASRAERLLHQPSVHASEFASLLAGLRDAVEENQDAGSRLGPLIRKVNRAMQAVRQSPIHWVRVLQGYLAIGHRPKEKDIENMQWTKVTHVLTLLSASEGSERIESLVRKAGLQWIWLPLPSAEPPADHLYARIEETYEELITALNKGGYIYIHCSAGIHRTGMITYGFLRYAGLPPNSARRLIGQLRPETMEGVGEERLQWGDGMEKK